MSKLSLGSFALDVRKRDFSGRAYGSTGIGPDGGYAVPTSFASDIFLLGEQSLAARCQIIPSTSGSVDVPVDEQAPWASDGIFAAWENEGATGSMRKPKLSLAEHRLRKLRVLLAASEELCADSDAFLAWFPKAMQRATDWKINDAIINGLGAGLPLGILNASATIEVAKAGGQAAATIVADNVRALLDRALNPLACTWVANPGTYGELSALAQFDSATRTLAGLPIALTDACAPLGSRGDLILANLAGYRIVTRGAQFAESAHLAFDEGLNVYRLVVRMDGQPILRGPTTPPNAGNTRSDFVVLAERA